MKNSKKVHIRGVVEDFESYGSTVDLNKEMIEAIQKYEDLFVNEFSSGPEVKLTPRRLASQKRKANIYRVTPPSASFGRGIVDLPEVLAARGRRPNR